MYTEMGGRRKSHFEVIFGKIVVEVVHADFSDRMGAYARRAN